METSVTEKPWGSFELISLNKKSTVKIHTIKPNQELSLQKHEKREEFWKVLSGRPIITIGDQKTTAAEGQEFFAGKGVVHRIAAGEQTAKILEVAFGNFDENDITRLEDKYGRV